MAVIKAHITGNVWKVEVNVGDTVAAGDTVIILESMKMEIPVEIEDDGGEVVAVLVKPGDAVKEGQALLELK